MPSKKERPKSTFFMKMGALDPRKPSTHGHGQEMAGEEHQGLRQDAGAPLDLGKCTKSKANAKADGTEI